MSVPGYNASRELTQPFRLTDAFATEAEGNAIHIGAVTAAMRVKGSTRRHFVYARPRLANPGRVVPIYRGIRERDPRRAGEPSPASMGAMATDFLELTLLEKSDGPLTKTIRLNGSNIISDGSDCRMSRGTARRVPIASIEEFAELTANLTSTQAWAMGALRDGLPDEVRVIVKGMPPTVAEKLKDGLLTALTAVLPDAATTGRVTRRSTSAGLRRTDTGDECPGSNSLHLYLTIADGADIGRALQVLHDRCWLAGLGWMMTSKSGALLERSVVDRMVGMPERLMFEGPPILFPPLSQDPELRRPVAVPGGTLDTRKALPDLNQTELSRLDRIKAAETARLAPEADKQRARHVAEQTADLVEKRKIPEAAARAIVVKRCNGILLPDAELPWDDDDLKDVTAGDVLRDPQKYEGRTLADPLEGTAYGRGKARVMIQYDGAPLIHSFAHGKTTYRLLWDYASTSAAIAVQTGVGAIDVLMAYDRVADFTSIETKQLSTLASSRSGVGKRPIEQDLKAQRKEAIKSKAAEERRRRLAARKDRRPRIPAPYADAERLPVMATVNSVLAQAKGGDQPPMRGYDGYVTQARMVRLLSMHAMTSDGANAEEGEGSRLQAPEQLLLHRLAPNEVEELIERHIEFFSVDPETGFERTVCLPEPFVAHYRIRHDDALPTVTGVVSMPLVLEDGTMLDENGLDEDSGLLFRIPKEMLRWIPKREDCTPAAVKTAMDFLIGEWLCDVLTDYQGKCVVIALALTLIERSLIAERPVFFITAGRRGGGKTTTILMSVMAVLGVRAAAAAWSPKEDERRKALLSYFLAGVAYIIWDNIPLGSQIFCPHIERSCTALYYVDRKLGVSETPVAPSTSVQIFTGNNIGPLGDLVSRSLGIRLETDRPDPENRTVTHQDPVGWTEANRGEILRALYTVMLGNPALGNKDVKLKTRFKQWWRLVGSAVENAARSACGHELDFAKLFAELEAEQEEEEVASLTDAILALYNMTGRVKKAVTAADIALSINNAGPKDDDIGGGRVLRAFLFPNAEEGALVSAKSVTRLLKKYVGNPVRVDGGVVLKLKARMSTERDRRMEYTADVIPAQGEMALEG